MSFQLKGKRILVTGGTAGIGLAVAKRLVDHGGRVVISGRRTDGEATAEGIGAEFIRADMANGNEVDQLFEQVLQLLGTLDVVINNAGVGWSTGEIVDTAMAEYDQMMGINMRAAFQVLKLAPGYMTEGGSIINTASISGMEGGAGSSVYAATKAALINLTQSATLELAPRGIRVNAVSPGPVRTEIWGDIDANAMSKLILPLGRIGEVEDCTGAYHFLASDDSRFITGINLVVDGGYSAGQARQLEGLVARELEKGQTA